MRITRTFIKMEPRGVFFSRKQWMASHFTAGWCYFADDETGSGTGSTPREAVADLRFQNRVFRKEGLRISE